MAHLILGRSSSQCSECGGNASPSDVRHIKGGLGSGYNNDSHLGCNNGCGVAWDYVEYTYCVSVKEAARLRDSFDLIVKTHVIE